MNSQSKPHPVAFYFHNVSQCHNPKNIPCQLQQFNFLVFSMLFYGFFLIIVFLRFLMIFVVSQPRRCPYLRLQGYPPRPSTRSTSTAARKRGGLRAATLRLKLLKPRGLQGFCCFVEELRQTNHFFGRLGM